MHIVLSIKTFDERSISGSEFLLDQSCVVTVVRVVRIVYDENATGYVLGINFHPSHAFAKIFVYIALFDIA